MAAKIKADVLQALDAWKAGKSVRSIELGHVQRMAHSEEHLQSYPNTRPQIDLTQRVSVDQERVHKYCFYLIDLFAVLGVPSSHEEFLAQIKNDIDLPSALRIGPKFVELSPEEKMAAESLAWKALLLGWRRAIDGFPDAHYIEVTNPAAVSAT